MTIHALREPRIAAPPPADSTPSPALGPTPRSTVAASEPPSPFAQLVRGLGHEVQRGETVVRDALASAHGRDLGPAELIALQAGVYRYSEAVDLASRLVDHATSGLKTVVQGQ